MEVEWRNWGKPLKVLLLNFEFDEADLDGPNIITLNCKHVVMKYPSHHWIRRPNSFTLRLTLKDISRPMQALFVLSFNQPRSTQSTHHFRVKMGSFCGRESTLGRLSTCSFLYEKELIGATLALRTETLEVFESPEIIECLLFGIPKLELKTLSLDRRVLAWLRWKARADWVAWFNGVLVCSIWTLNSVSWSNPGYW